MKLSICIIFHNQKKYINRCIESVLSQNITYDYEILLGDDNSTDGTWEELQKLVELHKNISCYRINSNDFSPISNSARSGLNRANLFRHINGEYFTFIDGDDFILDSNRYSKQIDVLENNPNISIVAGNTSKYLEASPIQFLDYITPPGKYPTGTIFTEKSFFTTFFHNSSCMIRKPQSFDIDHDFKPELFVDFKMTLFFLRYGDMYYIDEPFYAYMQNQTGIYTSVSEYSKHIGGLADIPDCMHFYKNTKNEYLQRFSYDIFYLVKYKGEKKVSKEDLIKLDYASHKLYNELGIFAEKNSLFKILINFLFIFEYINKFFRKIHLPVFYSIYKFIFFLCKIKKYEN